MSSPLTLGPHLGAEIKVTERGRIARYASRVLDADSQVVLLDQPFRNGRPVALRPGQQITVYLKGAGELWCFDTTVQSVYRTPQPMVLVPRSAELTRLERRNYVRVDARIPPVYFMLLDRHRNRGYGLQATIRNLSGGGVMFASPHSVQVGATIKMAFELPRRHGEVKAIGAVVYNRLAREIGNAVHAMGVAFTEIPASHRDAIIRFVLYRQAQMARARRESSFTRSIES
ncbi:MAG: flagellar brake protein [Anaerolineae bacterium]